MPARWQRPRQPALAVNAGDSGDNQDAELGRLRRQYPRWQMWRGCATHDYWAMPPRGHPIVRGLICASDIGKLADRIAQAQVWHDRAAWSGGQVLPMWSSSSSSPAPSHRRPAS